MPIINCTSCGKLIMFVRMASGNNTPVDLPPIKKIVKDPDDNIYAVTDCYTSHFETCPNAKEHRKEYPKGAIRHG